LPGSEFSECDSRPKAHNSYRPLADLSGGSVTAFVATPFRASLRRDHKPVPAFRGSTGAIVLHGRAADDIARGVKCFPAGQYLIYYRARRGTDILYIVHGARDQKAACKKSKPSRCQAW